MSTSTATNKGNEYQAAAAPWEETLYPMLQDDKAAAEYLNAAIEDARDDGNELVFLACLRDVVEARGGISQVAERTQLNRQHLYNMLSEDGNPRLNSLRGVLHSIGLELQVRTVAKEPDPT